MDITAFRTLLEKSHHATEAVVIGACAAATSGLEAFALFDGGANKGWHTIRMLRMKGCSRVYAVEADPAMAGVFCENLERWHKSAVELRFVHKALQDDPATTEIAWLSSESHPGRASIANFSAVRPTIHADLEHVRYRPPSTVPSTTIDQILADEALPLPFLKLDLEGADYLALRGAQATLLRHRPLVAFENSIKAPQIFGFTAEEAIAYFESLDYVACNFVGEEMNVNNFFQFYEAWLLPREQVAVLQQLIRDVVDRVATEAAQ